MELLSTVRITPDTATSTFTPTAFADWVGQHVLVDGLDPAHVHTLRAVEIIAGRRMVMDPQAGRYIEQVVPGGAAVLTVHTEAPYVPDVASYVQIVAGHPQARVRIVLDGGPELARGRYPAPMHEGLRIAVCDTEYSVIGVDWPNRHPEHGTSGGLEDYQVAYVVPVPVPPAVQLAVPGPHA